MGSVNFRELFGSVMLDGELEENLHVLCDRLGVRWPGTDGEVKAAHYLKEKLEEYGLENVRLEGFPLSTWLRGTINVELVAPFHRTLSGISLPNTGIHSVEGEGIFLDFSTMDEWRRLAPLARGKIVLCQGGPRREERLPIGRSQKARLAYEAGATGFVWVAEREGKVLLTGSVDGEVGEAIPCLTMAKEDASLLKRVFERNERIMLKIRTENARREIKAYNVEGEIPGRDADGPLVIAGAHYDGHDISDGAHDDASGTAAMLEAARALARYRGEFGATVRFVFFTAEEMGVVGSAAYVEQHADELDRVRFMLNADGVGRSPNELYLHLPLGGPAVHKLREAMANFRRPVVVEQSAMPLYWDHEGFALAGVPCGSITDPRASGAGWAHTVADTLDKLPTEGVRRAAAHIALIIALVANDADWPGRRHSPAEVQSILAQCGVDEAMVAARKAWLESLIPGGGRRQTFNSRRT